MTGTVRKAVLVVLLAAASGNALPAWVKLSVSGKTTAYVDPSTIVRDGDNVKMMELMDYSTTPEQNDGYLSTRRLSEYDCKDRQQRSITVAAYTGHMGTGSIVITATEPSRDWRPLVAGSVGEMLWKVACAKRGRST